ncbi:MAG: hypothetical protein HOY78_02260 [Saccharothrix sp.]|nr:hypothetical protein [Saccharothrix sp.]
MPTTSTPSPKPPRRTQARESALRQIVAQRVQYVRASGVYYLDGVEVSGARRRTFAGLVLADLATGGGQADRAPLELTDAGRALARDWELYSR